MVDDLCIGCTHCMSVCPTEAIRIRDGKAVILEDRCVDCGNCCKACPVSAILIEQDDFEDVFRRPVRIALLPSVLIGQFPSRIKTEEIYGALRHLGFTHVFEIDSVVDVVQEGYNHFLRDHEGERPLISTFCPAIVRLIQVRFPAMVDQLVRVKPPSDIAAIYFRRKLEAQGHAPEDIGVFYVTPCAAKITSIKSPVGEEQSAVTGVINMQFLYNKLLHLILNKESGTAEMSAMVQLSSKGILWSLTRGEAEHQEGRGLAVDGIRNVTEFLERLEESEECNIDFLELRACDESCAGGVLISGNRFLTVDRLNRRAEELRSEDRANGVDEHFDPEMHGLSPIPPRSMLVVDQDRQVAIQKIRQVEDMLKVLPGIDCGACGSPSCRVLAEDVVQGRSTLNACVFLQEIQLRDGRLSHFEADEINASIWGKDRGYRSQRK
ncbi:MAG: [Fe-Fe] hydrogenase large subunit C-terminal domain-containing protein [Bacteroidales bacterium]